MRLTLETPFDRLLTERSQMVAGWVDDPGTAFALTATCGRRALPVRPFTHPATRAGAALRGFWLYVIVQDLLDEIRDGRLALELAWAETPLARLDLRVSPVAEMLAREYPLDCAAYPVPRPPAATPPPPFTIVFPGLGAVGGASLNDLLRRRMFALGWELPLYHEADDPRVWRAVVAAGLLAPRWIDGHACYAAAAALPHSFARITLLREPLARLASVFDYNTLVHPAAFPFTRFDDFVLSGAARTWSQAHGLLRAAGRAVPDDLPDRDLEELARAELARGYALVGITERLEETIFLLCRLAGHEAIGMWWRILSAPRSVRPETLAPRVLRALERQLGPDLALYEERRTALAAAAERAAFGEALAAYRRAAAAQPVLPDVYKTVECLRWRQVMVESELARAQAAPSGRAA